MKTGLLVGEVMTKKPVIVPPNLSVKECARIMSNYDIGSLIIASGKKLLGIITRADIISKVVSDAKDPNIVSVDKIMTCELLTITPDKDVGDAMKLLRKHDVRHLPVVDTDGLVGFLTVKDILKVQPQLFDLLVDNITLREERRKLTLRSTEIIDEYLKMK